MDDLFEMVRNFNKANMAANKEQKIKEWAEKGQVEEMKARHSCILTVHLMEQLQQVKQPLCLVLLMIFKFPELIPQVRMITLVELGVEMGLHISRIRQLPPHHVVRVLLKQVIMLFFNCKKSKEIFKQ